MNNKGYFDGVALGIFITLTVTLVAIWSSESLSQNFSSIIGDLISGAATLCAGYLAISSATASLRHEVQKDARLNIEKLDAAKSVLPLSLSRLHDLCDNRIEILIHGKEDRSLFYIESNDIALIREAIEFSEDLEKSTLKEVVLALQIAESRFKKIDLNLDFVHPDQSDYTKYARSEAFLDWCGLKALIDCLFISSRHANLKPARESASTKAQFYLEYLESHDGIPLYSDSIFRRTLENAKIDQNFSFADPNWLTDAERRVTLHNKK